MSDPVVTPATTVVEGATPATPPADDRLEHATERLERLLPPVEGEAPPPAGSPAAEPPAVPPGAPGAAARPPSVPQAQLDWQAREAARQARAERVLLQRAERALLAQEERRRTAAPPAPAGADPLPMPDRNDDPDGWLQWHLDAQKRGMLDELQPVLEYARWAQQSAEQQRQSFEEDSRMAAWTAEQRQTVQEAEAMYLQTPEGQGYYDRYLYYVGHPGNPQTGDVPIDGVMTRALTRAGLPVQKARQITALNYQALALLALDNGINPAYFVDSIVREELESVARYSRGGAVAAPAGGRRSTAAPRNGAGEASRLNAAAREAAGGAGSLAAGSAPRGAGTPTTLPQGKLTGATVSDWIKSHYPDNPKLGLKRFRELAAQEAAAGG